MTEQFDGFAAVTLALLSLVGVFLLARWWRRRRAVAGWPTALATIETASVESWQQRYYRIYMAVIGYSFSVDGERYGGVFGVGTTSEDATADIAAKSKGMSISVRYKPDDPSDCEPVEARFANLPIMLESDWSRWANPRWPL